MKRPKPLPWKFERKDDADRHLKSAQRLITAIIQARGVLDKHRNEMLRHCLYKVTEIHGKHNLRYKSRATKGMLKAQVRHEHVIPRQELVKLMLKSPARIKKITSRAVACLVTLAEDERLRKEGKGLRGWNRYKAAKIVVIDTKTGRRWC